MLGISKRGDRYLRTLLIHGARSLLCRRRRLAHPRARYRAELRAGGFPARPSAGAVLERARAGKPLVVTPA
jgi:transposase